MQNSDNKFFLVWNPKTGKTDYRHATHEAAATEAKRLARCYPGEEFFTLLAIGKAKKIDIVYDVFEDHDDIPF